MQTADFYCGDVHVRGEYPAFAKRLWKEKGIESPFAEGDKEALKEGTVDFFTFSYYSSSTATDDPNVPVANGNMMRGPGLSMWIRITKVKEPWSEEGKTAFSGTRK